jgi:hypothetical protein
VEEKRVCESETTAMGSGMVDFLRSVSWYCVGYIVYSNREDPREIIVTECVFIERVLGSLSTNAVRCL